MLFTTSVPFRRTSMTFSNEGTTTVRVEGLVRVDPADVVIEYREHTTVQHNTGKVEKRQGEVRALRIPLAQIESVAYRRGLFGLRPRLVVQVRSLDLLAAFPYAKGARCVLGIALGDRERARDFATSLVDGITDAQLKLLERGELS